MGANSGCLGVNVGFGGYGGCLLFGDDMGVYLVCLSILFRGVFGNNMGCFGGSFREFLNRGIRG